MTFSFANYRDPAWNNFGPLRVMVENHIQPHSGFPSHPHRDVEIVTYVA
ncbi:MAG: pirin family protein, partial [Calditrichaeota bacterium]|nr:pirin family protein [Calditrichota bacterium]